MKNKILFTITAIAAIFFCLGVSLMDSTGFWFVVAIAMTGGSMGWLALFLFLNRGRL